MREKMITEPTISRSAIGRFGEVCLVAMALVAGTIVMLFMIASPKGRR